MGDDIQRKVRTALNSDEPSNHPSITTFDEENIKRYFGNFTDLFGTP